jgi:serine protease Do
VPTAQKVVKTPATVLPPPPAAPAAKPPAAPPAAAAPSAAERARHGVVVIERQGKPLALGFVLDSDGRVLTALSPLGQGNFITVRYQDGATAAAKLVVSDRGWDLALLAPSAPAPAKPVVKPGLAGSSPPPPQEHKAGLRAARLPSFGGLQSFALTPPATLAPTPVALSLSAGLLGADGATLGGAYELAQKPAVVGGPIINAEGEVVALVARACPANAGASCTPAPYAAPVSALKQFLQRVPAEATWLGIEGAADDARGVRGVRVVTLSPGGPAAMSGLRPGPSALEADLVVAVDGTPVATPAELSEAIRAHTLGDVVELLLYGMGRYRHVGVRPKPSPELTAPYAAPRPWRPRTPNPYR